jgi:hypothetical protein
MSSSLAVVISVSVTTIYVLANGDAKHRKTISYAGVGVLRAIASHSNSLLAHNRIVHLLTIEAIHSLTLDPVLLPTRVHQRDKIATEIESIDISRSAVA